MKINTVYFLVLGAENLLNALFQRIKVKNFLLALLRVDRNI